MDAIVAYRREIVARNDEILKLMPWSCRAKVYSPGSLPAWIVRKARPWRTTVHTSSMDTLDAAVVCGCTFVLNFANSHTLGGGYRVGALAQEETICRRSSLSRCLESVRYPWPHRDTVVYTPDVVVFRRGEGHKYEVVAPTECVKLAVASAAAFYHPPLTKDGQSFAEQKMADIMKEKMRDVLRVALHHGHHRVVLGAWGCGAFGGPPRQTACLWREVIGEREFANQFEHIEFAVLGEPNYSIFKAVLA